MAIDFKKGSDFLKSAMSKVGEAGKNVADATKNGMQSLSNKAQELSAQAKEKQLEELLKKDPPVFHDQYMAPTFELPQLIQIVTNEIKQEIEAYKGAMGWSNKEDGIEVMHLYQGAVDNSAIAFVPSADCDAVYCAHPLDKNCYIRLDNYFSYIQQAKLAELQRIAFALGVKHYWVELVETTNQSDKTKNTVSFNAMTAAKGSAEREMQMSTTAQSKSLAEMRFAEGREPQVPELYYFVKDKNIQELIAMRCSSDKRVMLTEYTIELSNSNTSAMSVSTAAKIAVAANKMGAGGSFQTQSAKEQNSKMIFKMEF